MPEFGSIEIYSYAYTGDNYGTKALLMDTPLFTVYFSYDLPIVLYDKLDDTLYIDTYPYSRTTSRHLSRAIMHAERKYPIEKKVEGVRIENVMGRLAKEKWVPRLAKKGDSIAIMTLAMILSKEL